MLALKAYVSFGWQFGLRLGQPVRDVTAIGILLGRGPLTQVHFIHFLAVEDDGDLVVLARNGVVVPFAWFLHSGFG